MYKIKCSFYLLENVLVLVLVLVYVGSLAFASALPMFPKKHDKLRPLKDLHLLHLLLAAQHKVAWLLAPTRD